MNISNTILEQIGGTLLVRINKINPGKAEIVAKVEFFNPLKRRSIERSGGG